MHGMCSNKDEGIVCSSIPFNTYFKMLITFPDMGIFSEYLMSYVLKFLGSI